mmetsp:Transcript_28251/g.55012  ORF Transcript_28251/g.55012 Transcript_28251/m.55012 type:complete len:241 (+) Transcript_28251:700-1422(+)
MARRAYEAMMIANGTNPSKSENYPVATANLKRLYSTPPPPPPGRAPLCPLMSHPSAIASLNPNLAYSSTLTATKTVKVKMMENSEFVQKIPLSLHRKRSEREALGCQVMTFTKRQRSSKDSQNVKGHSEIPVGMIPSSSYHSTQASTALWDYKRNQRVNLTSGLPMSEHLQHPAQHLPQPLPQQPPLQPPPIPPQHTSQHPRQNNDHVPSAGLQKTNLPLAVPKQPSIPPAPHYEYPHAR